AAVGFDPPRDRQRCRDATSAGPGRGERRRRAASCDGPAVVPRVARADPALDRWCAGRSRARCDRGDRARYHARAAGAGQLRRVATNTGIVRSVFSWYSAYGGYASTARRHHTSRSSPVTSRTVASKGSGPSWIVTASESALRLWYQTGCFGAPPIDATSAYSPSCSTRISGVLRSFPDLFPRVVTMTIGRPVSSSVFASRPPVRS